MNASEFAQSIRKKYPGSYDKVDDETLARRVVEKYPVYASKVSFEPTQATVGSVLMDTIKAPEQMSRQGFDLMSKSIPQPQPTGNLPMDLLKGTPAVLGKSLAETAGKVAPGFVSPLSILLGTGGAVLKGASKIPMVRSGANAVGRSMASGVEKVTGIPADSVRSVFKNPFSIFTAPTKKKVAEAYAKSEFPEMAKGLDDTFSEATGSYAGKVKVGARAVKEWVEKNISNPRKIIDARKALDKEIALLQNQIDASRGPGRSALESALRSKQELRYAFNRTLDIISPLFRKADAVASKNLAVNPFRKLTLPGKIHLYSTEGLLRAVPGLPTAIGLGTSASGGVAKVAGAGIRNAPKLGYLTGAGISAKRRKQ